MEQSATSQALQNDLILENIFRFLRFKTLKACRLVCRKWRLNSLKVWRVSAMVRWLETTTDMTNFHNFARRTSSAADFGTFTFLCMTLSESESSHPFWALCGPHIKVLNFSQIEFKSACTLQKVLSEGCPNISVLELYRIEFDSTEDFRKIVYQGCPNMKHLSLNHVYVHFGGEAVMEPSTYVEPEFGEHKNLKSLSIWKGEHSLGLSWMELLNHFPALESIDLTAYMLNVDGFFTSLRLIRQHDASKLKLKHLYTSGASWEPTIPGALEHALCNSGLQLETLAYDYNRADKRSTTLQEILMSHAKSLEKLMLCGFMSSGLDPNNHVFSMYGSLEFLRELVLRNSPLSLSLSLLKYTPNLKNLSVQCHRNSKHFTSVLQDLKGVSLVKCLEFVMYEPVTTPDFLLLTKMMPNLEVLEMPLNNEQFSLMCNRLTNLVTVKTRDYSQKINTRSRALTKNAITPANITKLKHLRVFEMYASKGSTLSSSSALGFQQLPQLKHLDIQNVTLEGDLWKTLIAQFPPAESRRYAKGFGTHF